MGSILLGMMLVVVGAVLLLRHRAVWKSQREESAGEARRFHVKQYYRRMQASGLIVLIGLYFLGERFVVDPYWQIAYWALVVVLVTCLMILAIVDLVSTRRHYHELKSEFVARQAALEKEATRLQQIAAGERNGHRDLHDL